MVENNSSVQKKRWSICHLQKTSDKGPPPAPVISQGVWIFKGDWLNRDSNYQLKSQQPGPCHEHYTLSSY